MRFLTVVRLVLSALLFATATLAVLTAPTHFLWMAAVGVTEWGHALALICIGAGVLLWSNSWSGRVAVALCLGAAALAVTPVLRASRVASALPGQLNAAFGEAIPARPSPLVYGDLFRGISPPPVQPETFVYTTVEETDLAIDFYRAQASSPAPVVIVIHGGSWQSGDNKDFVPMDQYLAGRGFAAADLTYRLAPRWRFPAAIDDVRTAMEFLRARAGPLNIDPNRIVLLGRSAGGEIALTAAYSARDPGIRGVISFYAPADLYWSWENPGNPLVIDTRGVLTDYLGGSPTAALSNYEAGSPIRLVTSDVPPTLLFHGGRDELVSPFQSHRLAERLAQAGVPHLNVELPWATHGFDFIFRGPGGQISTYAIEYFLQRVTRFKIEEPSWRALDRRYVLTSSCEESMFGQTFETQDFAIIALLIVLEGVLSIDNALVLGLLAKRLPRHEQKSALTYGLVGAFLFRFIAIGTAAYLLRWRIVKLFGGGYLMYIALKHFFIDSRKPDDKGGQEDAPLPVRPGKSVNFWSTVFVIELTDIAFAIDSILAAIALVGSAPLGHVGPHPKLWVVMTGGFLGLLLMRFAAVLFITLLEKFPRFEMSAYLLVCLIGMKLLVDWLANTPEEPHAVDFHSPSSAAFWVFWILMLVCFSLGFLKPKPEAKAGA